jgi:hypothetical protein
VAALEVLFGLIIDIKDGISSARVDALKRLSSYHNKITPQD